MSHLRPSPEEHNQLLQEIGPLPIKGMAWPAWIKLMAWATLAFIGFQIIRIAAGPLGQNISPMVTGSIIVCYVGLLVLARYMQISVTSITETGIQQSWLGRREIAWEEIQFVKFIPLLASKKMICFPARGRPVVFQAGTKELQIAFARISLVYRRRK
ncbi:hypothetical protein LKR43_05430 [Pusillimonas sp. MFBS29]|uniref:hypothetical protein n=1 Tax=Pusillimonas sp. MFBS29 TaxID=2886690 RepID=UPI001D128E6E|nr:hypothetical protein [Pusillimonas sp. MFBS29]MCC2595776.1 hypothetical protein [Pusillimonas sp. MFBS29]